MKWIKTSDYPPPRDGTRILIYRNDIHEDRISVRSWCAYDSDDRFPDGVWEDENGWCIADRYVKYWMPLPVHPDGVDQQIESDTKKEDK